MFLNKLEKYSSNVAAISENFETLTYFDLIKLSEPIRTIIKKKRLSIVYYF